MKKVAATPSSIGYANLADARSNGAFTPGPGKGGEKTARFWVELENKPGEESYADPSSNKDAEKAANANCSGEEYADANSKGEPEPFPPPNTLEPWNKVTAKLDQKAYLLCGLTYDLAFNKYSDYPGTSFGEATTVSNFLQFVLQTTSEGGGELIKDHDYLALSAGLVLTEAQRGAAEIAY